MVRSKMNVEQYGEELGTIICGVSLSRIDVVNKDCVLVRENRGGDDWVLGMLELVGGAVGITF
jgi:hypothetical protein